MCSTCGRDGGRKIEEGEEEEGGKKEKRREESFSVRRRFLQPR